MFQILFVNRANRHVSKMYLDRHYFLYKSERLLEDHRVAIRNPNVSQVFHRLRDTIDIQNRLQDQLAVQEQPYSMEVWPNYNIINNIFSLYGNKEIIRMSILLEYSGLGRPSVKRPKCEEQQGLLRKRWCIQGLRLTRGIWSLAKDPCEEWLHWNIKS